MERWSSCKLLCLTLFPLGHLPVASSAFLKARGQLQIRASLCIQKCSLLTVFRPLCICFPGVYDIGHFWYFVSRVDWELHLEIRNCSQQRLLVCVCIAEAREFHTECNFWALNSSLMLRPTAREAILSGFILELVQGWECCWDLWLLGSGSLPPFNLAVSH